jgi:hypothetical protein
MRQPVFAIVAAVVFLVRSAPAQQEACSWPEMKASPQNLDFSQGSVGSAPAAWLLGPEWFMPPHVPVYEALIAGVDQCHGSPQCATVHSSRKDPSIARSFLYQDLDASPYRGQTLVYRAFVRVARSEGSVARLLVRVHRKDCSTTFRDDMGNQPVTSGAWGAYEIRAPIAEDAYHIEFGVQLVGGGALWIDEVSMEFKPARGN